MSRHQVAGDFILAEGEKMMVCPYNVAHQITNARHHQHLSKCRADYKKLMTQLGRKVKQVHCRWDYKHVVPDKEQNFHEATCPSQGKIVDTMAFHSDPARVQAQYAHVTKDVDWGDEAEDWEEDSRDDYVPAYDPQAKLDKEIVLHHPIGLTKSERKHHRNEQRMKARGDYEGHGQGEEEDWGEDGDDLTQKFADLKPPSTSTASSIPKKKPNNNNKEGAKGPMSFSELVKQGKGNELFPEMEKPLPQPSTIWLQHKNLQKIMGDDEFAEYKGEDPFEGWEE